MHEREEIEYTGKNCVFEIGGISDLAYPGKIVNLPTVKKLI